MNRRRTNHLLSTLPHTYGLRVCSCAAFSTEPCRPTACAGEPPCCTAAYSATAHYSLLTANSPADFLAPPVPLIQHSAFNIQHWSYTFSAKEKDSETGLSYFGSRYYSFDLSVWLSVDPMASKYPSLSPYTYCADNPVKLVDPNGEEIVLETIYKKDANGNDTKEIERFNIRITGKILNCSNKNIDMDQARNDIVNQIESSFSGTTLSGIPVTTTADFTVVNSLKKVDEKDHLIMLSNDVRLTDGNTCKGVVQGYGTTKAWVDADLFKGPYDALNKTGAKAAAHEMGHLLGLGHDSSFTNLMRSPHFGTNISSNQLSKIVKTLQVDQKLNIPKFRLLNNR